MPMYISIFMRKVFLLLVALIPSLSMMAQATKFIEFQPSISVGKGDSGANLGFQLGFLKPVTDNVEVGAGFGIMEHSSFSTNPGIPLFFRSKYNVSQNESIKPFITADLGYMLNTDDIEAGSIIINPSVGVSFDKYYIAAGYLASIFTKGGGVSNYINLRFGCNFGKGSGLENFFKRTKVALELAGGTGISEAKYKIERSQELVATAKVKDMVSLRLFWTYEINDNWEAGIGAGCNLYDTEESGPYTQNQGYIQIPLFVRGQYTHFDADTKIRPYAAVDLGATIHEGANIYMNNEGFFVEPQVGVKFNNKYNAGVGVEFVNFDGQKWNQGNYPTSGGGASILKLHLGIEL